MWDLEPIVITIRRDSPEAAALAALVTEGRAVKFAVSDVVVGPSKRDNDPEGVDVTLVVAGTVNL